MLWKKKKPEHKLVVIGDSLSQGFQNGGIYRTDLSFPGFLSQCFEPELPFDQPLFTAQGGIPINLEILIRGISEKYNEPFKWSDYLAAANDLYSTLRRIKRYWEGGMKSLERNQSIPYHNQSIWGFSINDTWRVTDRRSRDFIKNHPETYSIFDVLPDHAMYTTASLVLNPAQRKQFMDHSQLDNVEYLQENGGIENLIVTIGHNNIIGAVTDLEVIYSTKDDLEVLPSERKFTVYRPEHFEMEYLKMAQRIKKTGVDRVVVQTIPYVTVPPVIRGVNEDLSRKRGGYFDYYTRFWIWDTDFDPDKHPHLTREQAIELDQVVDEYNTIIRSVAKEYDWIVVPLNKQVNAIARRRLGGNIKRPYPSEFCRAMKKNPNTAHLVDDPHRPLLSTNYIKVDEETRKLSKGGIFSLDGIHPTTIGYGLMAQAYYDAMEENGVKFQKPLDWDYIIENDTLVTDPPHLLVELRKLLRFLSLDRQERFSLLGQNVLHQVLQLFSQRRERQPAD